ncbi:MAG: hypothetical protein AAF299_08360 [Pseudomonadota bacterium]
MKKLLLTTSVALFAFAGPVNAADYEREMGLIVSGVVDSWAGVQFIDDGVEDDTVFTNGGEGLLSLPLGDNLSIQTDVKYEYNTNATESPADIDVFGPRFSYQFATHASWRDPSRGLFGAFGGMGSVDSSIGFGSSFRQDHRFVGAEAQFYIDNFTLYGQGGYVETSNDFFGLDDGFFARGVVRYFLTNDSRIQLEGTYINMDYNIGAFGDMEAFSVKARYDFVLAGMPVIGDTPIYLGYRGTFRDNCAFTEDLDDHTIMVGTSYSFSGDRLTVDRQGATLDTPDFAIGCVNDTGVIN